MTLTDPIGDMFSRIRNGQMRSLHSIDVPSSNFRRNILEILKNEGFIKDYYIEKSENNTSTTTETVDDSDIPVFENNQTQEDDLPF